MSTFLQFFLVWTCLLIVHFPSLTDPAYWDTILGSFHQAIWLKNNHFDQIGLCRSEPSYTMGGPKVYTNSIYPLVQAVLMTWIPNVKVFLVFNHLAQIGFSAGAVVAFFHIVKRMMPPLCAGIFTGILASLPMFHTLTSTINMDMPTVFFSVLAMLLYTRKQFGSMIIALIIGVLIKQSIAIGIIAFTFLSFVRISNRTELKWSLLLLIPFLLSFWNYFVAYFLEPKDLTVTELSMKVSDWVFDPKKIYDHIELLFGCVPDQTVLLVSTLVASVLYGTVFLILFIRTAVVTQTEKIKALRNFVAEREIILLSAAMIFGFAVLYYSMNINLPRYSIWVYPFELLFVAALLRKAPIVLAVLSVIVILANIINHDGYLYRLQDKAPLYGYAMYLERSMEFRDDLICNQKMAEMAEEKLQGVDIVTCWPFTHMLSAPEFGYIKKPLSIVCVNMGAELGLPGLHVPPVKEWLKNRGSTPKPYVFISTVSNFFGPILFDPQKHNLVLRIDHRDRFIWVFQEK